MKNFQDRIKEYEKIFDEYANKYSKKEKSYKTIKGKLPVLISAPHSVRQLRNGKIKERELYTGAIVVEIANQSNCFAIYKIFNNQDDANYDVENNEYKEEVLKIIKENDIKLFIDIHGADDNDIFDIDIGTNNYNNLNGKKEIVNSFENICKEKGINKIGIDEKFKADTFHTITKTVAANTNIPSIQIEITRKYRKIDQISDMKKIIESIIQLINQYKEKEKL